MPVAPSFARLRARLGAYSLHAQRDPRETTAAARRAFLDRFLEEVDPFGDLPEDERLRRAEAAKHAYFTRLQLKSAAAKAKKRASKQKGEVSSEP